MTVARLRHLLAARWVHPDTQEIVKFWPSTPPQRGDVVLVDGERCRVLRAKVRWRELGVWTIYGTGVKVRPT